MKFCSKKIFATSPCEMQIIELQLVGKSEASLLLRYKNKRHIHIEKNHLYV